MEEDDNGIEEEDEDCGAAPEEDDRVEDLESTLRFPPMLSIS